MIYHFKGSTKEIDVNDFIDAETVFNNIMFKPIISEDVQKSQMKFESNLSSARVRGNKSEKQLYEKNTKKF